MILNLEILLLQETMCLDKFIGADFKYDNFFFKFQSKSTQIRRFCFQNYRFLFLHEALSKEQVCWFQIWKYFFKINIQKYPSKGILVQNLKKCWFYTKFCILTYLRMLISNLTIFFPNFSYRTTQMRDFCFQM